MDLWEALPEALQFIVVLLAVLPGYLFVGVNASSSAPVAKVPARYVVGAGLGRTGTASLQIALEALVYHKTRGMNDPTNYEDSPSRGVGPIFHMKESISMPHMLPLWRSLAEASPLAYSSSKVTSTPAWPPLFPDELAETRVALLGQLMGLPSAETSPYNNQVFFRSSIDFPTCVFFRDLLEAYVHVATDYDQQPRQAVKVLLTSRTSGNKWAQSALSAILNWHPSRRPFGIRVMFATWPWFWRPAAMLHYTFFRYFPDEMLDEDVDRLATYHDDWNDHVRHFMQEYAREHNLRLEEIFLEYQLGQGWQPLCDFLGGFGDGPNNRYPTEDTTPFPHINDKEHYQNALRFMNVCGYIWMMVIALIMWGFVYLARKVASFGKKSHTSGKDKAA